MNIFLTGGTGFVGSAVLRSLLVAGHQVAALVPSEASADKVRAQGAAPVVGDVTDTDWLTAQLSGVDGAIHTASPGDASSAAVDDLAALYLLVLQAGRRLGSVVGVTADTPTVRELAEATGSPVAPEAVDATRARLGEAFADALLLDQQFDDGYARSLGWTPTAPTLAEELRSGSYAS